MTGRELIRKLVEYSWVDLDKPVDIRITRRDEHGAVVESGIAPLTLVMFCFGPNIDLCIEDTQIEWRK